MEFLQLYLLLQIALKHNSNTVITIKQNFADDHSLDAHTVITVIPKNDTEYEILYQDFTCTDGVATIRLNKGYLKAYLMEVIKHDCLPAETVLTVKNVICGENFDIGRLDIELTEAFWFD